MPRKTIASLEVELMQLNAYKLKKERVDREINKTLGLEYSADDTDRLVSIEKMRLRLTCGKEEGSEQQRGYLELENARLWFLVRTLIKDNLLERESEVIQRSPNSDEFTSTIITPFSTNRY